MTSTASLEDKVGENIAKVASNVDKVANSVLDDLTASRGGLEVRRVFVQTRPKPVYVQNKTEIVDEEVREVRDQVQGDREGPEQAEGAAVPAPPPPPPPPPPRPGFWRFPSAEMGENGVWHLPENRM